MAEKQVSMEGKGMTGKKRILRMAERKKKTISWHRKEGSKHTHERTLNF